MTNTIGTVIPPIGYEKQIHLTSTVPFPVSPLVIPPHPPLKTGDEPPASQPLVHPSAIQRVTYAVAGQTIATHVTGDPVSGNNGFFYLYTDHLGSTTLLRKRGTSAILSGSTAYYLPFGSYRPDSTTPTQTITDKGYTGHRHNNLPGSNNLGLIYMNARYYLPGIARFASADTIVPDPVNPQDYNRYSYVTNNPLLYVDPTGHFTEDAIQQYLINTYGEDLGSTFFYEWQEDQDWWQMLLLAQAGDILFTGHEISNNHLGAFYVFKGQGKYILDGIERSDPYGNPYSSGISYDDEYLSTLTLLDFFSGWAPEQGPGTFAFSKTFQGDRVTWSGLLRWIDGVPSFLVPSSQGYSASTATDADRIKMSRGWNIIGFVLGSLIPGSNAVKAGGGLVIAWFSPNMDGWWQDVRNMESGDVQVTIGSSDFWGRGVKHHLVFRADNGGPWRLVFAEYNGGNYWKE